MKRIVAYHPVVDLNGTLVEVTVDEFMPNEDVVSELKKRAGVDDPAEILGMVMDGKCERVSVLDNIGGFDRSGVVDFV